MKKGAADFSRCDLFGQTIAFTFKGHSDYRSVFGSVMTVGSAIVFAIFFSIRTRALLSGENASMFVTDMPHPDLAIDLIDLGYYFAVEEIPQEVGTLRLRSLRPGSDGQDGDSDGRRDEMGEVPLKECTGEYLKLFSGVRS